MATRAQRRQAGYPDTLETREAVSIATLPITALLVATITALMVASIATSLVATSVCSAFEDVTLPPRVSSR